ncbi:MAG: phenylacetate--CoA ligase family protein [Acidimicrobiia bacterium]
MPASGPEVLGPRARDPKQRFWDGHVQTMSRERRRALQDDRVRELVRRVFETPVPLFRHKLAHAGVDDARAVAGADDLAHLPLTRKQDLRDSEAAVPPWGDYRFTPPSACVRLGQSTGTTGTPTVMLWTRHDLWVEYESAARNWWRMGYRPGMSITHAHPGYLYGGGVMQSGTYEYFGLLNIWVPPPDTDERAEEGIRAWMRFRPDIPFVGFSLGRYYEVAAKLGLDPEHDIGLRVPSMLIGRHDDKGLPLMTAGLECYAYLGGPCGKSSGAHINEDWAVVQAVDPDTGVEVPDGEWGNLVVTTLDRDNPMLRYDLEEACAITRDPCPCGETTIRGSWGGRFGDLLTCQGIRFQPSELERALRAGAPELAEPSLEYVIVKPSRDEPLRVRVEVGAGAFDRAALARCCEAAIAEHLGVRAAVEVLDRGSLPRSGYKANRVVDS